MSTGAPDGVYLSVEDPDGVEIAPCELGLGEQDVDLLVATEPRRSRVGDWGSERYWRYRSASWPSTPRRPAVCLIV